jgi:tRNA-Thr(GGU) m(6)t(6)A37 methyltransferase TsaA
VDRPEPVTYTPIGVVRSPYAALDGMPLQTVAATEVEATVELDPRVHAALRDLDGFSHLWLVAHLHRVEAWAPEVVPFLDTQPRGVLATRSPRHPNPIGLSVVELLSVEPGVLRIRGIDLLDGTPVLDVKPVVPEFDVVRADVRTGWFDAAAARVRSVRSDTRYGA